MLRIYIYKEENMDNYTDYINRLGEDKFICKETANELLHELLKSELVYTDNYHVSLFCLVNEIPTINLNDSKYIINLYKTLECENYLSMEKDSLLEKYMEYQFRINTDILNKYRSSIKDIEIKIIKRILRHNLRVIHLGSYWQGENDIVKLMVDDLKDICRTKEVDTRIYDMNPDKEKWYSDYEPYPKKYSGKYIRYISDDKIINLIDIVKPHIIITNSGGLTFSKKVFKLLNRLNITTIGISLSDPDVFPYNGKLYYERYDYFYTNSMLSLKEQYKNKDKTDVKLLPFACSTKLHKPLDIPKKYDIIIVAGARPERIKIIDRLKLDFNIGVYGGGYPSSYKAYKVNGKAHVEALNKGKIYISFGQTAAGYMNVKVGLFEAAACKLVLVTNDSEEVKRYFKSGLELITFKNLNHLIYKLKYLLKDKDRLEALSNNSYQRFLKDHQWKNRWIELLMNII
jgi:hypothetical protein